MSSLQESLSYWTTILGAIAAFFGVIQSVNWLTGIGAVFFTGSILALAYGTHQRQRLNLANLRAEGRSIDSLNIANLRLRKQKSHHSGSPQHCRDPRRGLAHPLAVHRVLSGGTRIYH